MTLFVWITMAGCASGPDVQPGASQGNPPAAPRITGVEVEGGDDSVIIRIRGERIPETAPTLTESEGSLSLDFPETETGSVSAPEVPDGGMIHRIILLPMSPQVRTAQIRIETVGKPLHEITREGSDFTLTLQKNQPAVSVPETQPMAQHLNHISPIALENGTRLHVAADGTIRNYSSFTLEQPARIVFDIPGVSSPHKREQTIAVHRPGVRTVRYFGDSQKLRLVIDTDSPYLGSYSETPVPDGLEITVAEKSISVDSPPKIASPPAPNSAPAAEARLQRLAWVNRIDFLDLESGRSEVTVGTTQPVTFSVKREGPQLVRLVLENTGISDYRKHPLITNRFESAVDRIVPSVSKTGKNIAHIDIHLRQEVPYQAEQDGDRVYIRFEPSSVPPQPARLTAAGTGVGEKPVAVKPPETPVSPAPSFGAPPENAAIDSRRSDTYRSEVPKVYTGEKIAFDFFDTDIRNVFKIIGDISGENFAVDPGVTGKVTLNLGKPVPWDQALDLVLRMNGLDKVREGNIIRIATVKRLEEEEKNRQSLLKAEKDARDQIVELEPLVTEYLAINYAKAAEEMKPHLDGILTPGRGTITVDSRTNQIIMTDIPEKITKAKEIIRKLDRVTPQVVIEAKIVEATTDFTRGLGVDWNMSSGIQGTDSNAGIGPQRGFDVLGGTYGYNAAVNLPLADPKGQIGFNFTKIAGTPLVINATLMAMESNGQGKIISSPKILTMDNKEAFIEQGLEVGYLEKSMTEEAPSVKFKKVTLNLKVVPHVTMDNRISLKMEITKDDVLSYFEGVPIINTKKATTELLLDDGDTLVIGGITKTSDQSTTSGIPGFSKIPLLGWLFKTKEDTRSNEELLIFMTPRILQLEQRAMFPETGNS